MRLKVHGGTSQDKPLCGQCKYLRRRKLANNDEVMLCSAHYQMPVRIFKPVVECNDFLHVTHISIYDMQKMAWYLRTNASGNAVGFMSRKEFADKYGEDEADRTGLE